MKKDITCDVVECPKYNGGHKQHCSYVDPLKCSLRLKIVHLRKAIPDVAAWMDSYHKAEIMCGELKHEIGVLKMEREVDQEEVTGHREAEKLLAKERDGLRMLLVLHLEGEYCHKNNAHKECELSPCGSVKCVDLHLAQQEEK